MWAVLLGIVQGLTEFLPVSSSGHLAVLQEVLGMEGPRLLMTTALHVGTLASILVVFRRDVVELVRGPLGMIAPGRWGRGKGGTASDEDRKGLVVVVAVAIAALVTAPIGLVLEPRVEHMSRDMFSVGGFFLITGLLLVGTRFLLPGKREVGYLLALPVGIAQGLAVFPGISRSGATIVVALLMGARREEAVRFSFLAALPVLAGAMILESGLEAAELAARWHVYLTGAIVSFLVGWASLRILIRLTVGGGLHWFTPYLLILGLALMLS